MTLITRYIMTIDPVYYLPDDIPVCLYCKVSLKAVLEEIRVEIWNNLPSILGLKKWEEWKDFDQ